MRVDYFLALCRGEYLGRENNIRDKIPLWYLVQVAVRRKELEGSKEKRNTKKERRNLKQITPSPSIPPHGERQVRGGFTEIC